MSICTATGARSSSHSEIVQTPGPPLALVDNPPAPQPPGGYSEWGLRRHAAALTLGAKAIEQATALLQGKPTFRTLKVALLASGTCTMVFGDPATKQLFNSMTIAIWRALVRCPATIEEERARLVGPIGLMLLMRDLKNAIADGQSLEW